MTLKTLTLSIAALLVFGCATNRDTAGTRDNDAIAKMLKDNQETPSNEVIPPTLPEKTERPVEKSEGMKITNGHSSSQEIENLTLDEVIRIEEPNVQTLYDNSRYDFPITVNGRVEGWIDYFTGRGKQHMERYLARSSRYIPMMRKMFKSQGLPEDLVYLALIESGFNLKAKSRARAVGPWQFMKATGKRYGLRVDSWVDERRDPIASTEAAANYLKDLYLMFESWYLAASAYNAGEYKILRAIENLKTNNYWRISQTSHIRRETKDYIPKLIAAAIIAKNPARYGFGDVAYQEPLEYESITVDHPLKIKTLAKIVDADEEELSELNPSFVHSMVPPHGGPYEVRIPSGTKFLVERALSSSPKSTLSAEVPHEHTVRSGENLATIAKRYRMRTKDLANANNISPRERLASGMKLVIPRKYEGAVAKYIDKAPAKPKQEKVSEKDRALASTPDSDGFIIHKVKAGESLWSIAETYNVTVQNLFKWNNLRRSFIRPGKPLKVKTTSKVQDSSNSKKSRRSKRT